MHSQATDEDWNFARQYDVIFDRIRREEAEEPRKAKDGKEETQVE